MDAGARVDKTPIPIRPSTLRCAVLCCAAMRAAAMITLQVCAVAHQTRDLYSLLLAAHNMAIAHPTRVSNSSRLRIDRESGSEVGYRRRESLPFANRLSSISLVLP